MSLQLQISDALRTGRLILSCVWCRKLYVLVSSRNVKYCQECGKKMRLRRERERYIAKRESNRAGRTCAQCGESIAHLRANNDYCGEGCRKEGRRAKQRERYIAKQESNKAGRTCAQCGESIAHLHANNDYCGEGCRKEGRRATFRAYRKCNRSGRSRERDKARKFLLAKIIQQRGLCFDCRMALPLDSKQIHMDHRIPWSRGGTNDPSNIVAVCLSCNLSKGARLPTITDPQLDLGNPPTDYGDQT